MTAPPLAHVSRRTVVAGLAAAPAALLASCSLTRSGRATSLAEVPDNDARRRWSAFRIEQGLATAMTTTAAAHPDLAEPLTLYADLHRQHATALREEGPLPRLADPDTEPAAPEVPASPEAAITTLGEAVDAAVEALLAGCTACQGPRLATVLASIAASDAGIATVVRSL